MYPKFTVGPTSFLIPAGWADNVRHAAARVKNIELLFCEIAEDGGDMISAAEIEEIRRLGEAHDLSFSVHLPVDIDLTRASSARFAVEKIGRLLGRIAPLAARAFVLHVEDKSGGGSAREWMPCATAAVGEIAAALPDTRMLALENIEGQPLDWLDEILAKLPVSRCVDIGHLWKDGLDPAPILKRWLPRTHCIHLHGLADRDHRSLAHMTPAAIDSVVHPLVEAGFPGVVTLEVFKEADFWSSFEAFEASLERHRITKSFHHGKIDSLHPRRHS